MGNFFPNFGSYGTGNPLLDHLWGGANEEEEEDMGIDPFTGEPITQADIDAQVGSYGDALPEGEDAAAAPAAPAAPEVRTLQKRELINKERRKKKEAEAKAKGAAAAEQGLTTGGLTTGGLTTGGLTTYGRGGVISGQQQGGFGKQIKLNPARR